MIAQVMADEYNIKGRSGKQCKDRYWCIIMKGINLFLMTIKMSLNGITPSNKNSFSCTVSWETNGQSLDSKLWTSISLLIQGLIMKWKITFIPNSGRPWGNSTKQLNNTSKSSLRKLSKISSIKLLKVQRISLKTRLFLISKSRSIVHVISCWKFRVENENVGLQLWRCEH